MRLAFFGLPEIPVIGMMRPTLVAEVALALWLLVVGVTEPRWREQATVARAALLGGEP